MSGQLFFYPTLSPLFAGWVPQEACPDADWVCRGLSRKCSWNLHLERAGAGQGRGRSWAVMSSFSEVSVSMESSGWCLGELWSWDGPSELSQVGMRRSGRTSQWSQLLAEVYVTLDKSVTTGGAERWGGLPGALNAGAGAGLGSLVLQGDLDSVSQWKPSGITWFGALLGLWGFLCKRI